MPGAYNDLISTYDSSMDVMRSVNLLSRAARDSDKSGGEHPTRAMKLLRGIQLRVDVTIQRVR